MISEIEIVNIQPYEYAILSFSEKLNVISGRTHSGKSSVIRAIKWLLQNRPIGDKLLRDNTDNCSVTASFVDGSFVSREKNAKIGKNVYICSDINEPLSALKTDLPDEVKSITKMGEENLQSQGDKYFLIGKTPGKVASEINKVVGLQIIDEKRSKIKSIISDYSSQVKALKFQISDTEGELKSAEFIKADLLSPIIKKIEEDKTTLSSIISELTSVNTLISSIDYQRTKMLKAERIVSNEFAVRSLKGKISNHKEVVNKISFVSRVSSSIEILKTKVYHLNNFLLIEPEISILKDKVEAAFAIRLNIDKVSVLYEDITSLEEAKIHMLQSVAEYKKIINSLKEKLKYCSKCGADRKHWKLDKIKEGI